ncbi:MAG TPA: M48 family metallopeptidase [Sphingomonas sp.]|uniref:M48 family metallopeptidase n=1 Tax=Sphingomonas sp. TaxID=28214 RepID=UPI002C2F26BA|nr:M48 family metallopeptidase [Sphingomonas sp.]HMI18430.1 M48 family metallopeptidase [Sphingomonas sp.]
MIALIGLAGMLDVLRQADARVAAVAWRLQTANLSLCADPAALAGFSVETLDQYAVAERAEAGAQFGLRDRPQISAVAPGSAAEKAGLRAGDEIVAVDDVPVPPGQGGKPSYARTAAVEAALAAALAKPPVKLTLAARTVYLTGDRGCPSAVQLVPGGRFDASADGHYVQISGPMYEFAVGDDELAFLIGHELAHNLVPEAKRAASGKAQRAAELAADRSAIRMMAGAGYDVSVVVPFLDRLRGKAPLSWLDGTHPSWSTRVAAAAAAVASVRAGMP